MYYLTIIAFEKYQYYLKKYIYLQYHKKMDLMQLYLNLYSYLIFQNNSHTFKKLKWIKKEKFKIFYLYFLKFQLQQMNSNMDQTNLKMLNHDFLKLGTLKD